MLEVRNLTKAYKNKKGVVTKALDGVSLTFPEKGMVFILGKSGSGKSTLLNICGGLDRADSGEIIIKGKSSNEFSGHDFDSYRNTYVGFVFQEYNILDEFTVEENIGMALELQNKKRDKDTIDKILSDVDMSSFASRKPNTLSGGQKQRVAIARALVKEPEIIMADEPTGALDSKTGQQVFDTLKNLSKDKLVLVISHDRDFAEQYADRIIELKDGQILSDQVRLKEGENARNVRFYSTDTVCVANGSLITDEDLQNIKKFLQRSGGSAVISTSRSQMSRMMEDRPEISVGAFENIKEQPRHNEYEKQKLIRSHLPLRHAVKMGANSLKSKPFRLFFSIFLSIIALILFGLASTLMLFDGKSTTIQTFVDSDDKYMILSKGYYGKYVQYINGNVDYMSDEDEKQITRYTIEEYKELSKKYPGSIAVSEYSNRIENIRLSQFAVEYYTDNIYKAILVNEDIKMQYGAYPKAKDEIALSKFIYDGISLENSKYIDSKGKEISIKKPEDLLYSETNKRTINLGGRQYKVVGIYEIDTPSSEFDAIKQAAEDNSKFKGEDILLEKWRNNLNRGILSSIMVTEDFITINSQKLNGTLPIDKYFYRTGGQLNILTNTDYGSGYIEYVSKLDKEKALKIYDFSGNSVSSLSDNQVALHAYKVGRLYYEVYQNYINKLTGSYEEEEKRQNAWKVEKEAFEQEYLLIEKYFKEENYNNALNDWQYNYDNVKNEEGFNEQEYLEANPRPTKLDKNIWGKGPDEYEYKYYLPDESYNNALNERRNYVMQTAGTISEYNTLIYNVRKKADTEFRKSYPEPIYPENGTAEEKDKYNEEYQIWNQEYWNYLYEEQNKVDPIYKLNNLQSLSLTKEGILDLFEETRQYFKECEFNVGIVNEYNKDLNPITISGIFFDNVYDSSAYLSNNLYDAYYVQNSEYDNYWSEYLTKYVEKENAIFEYVFVPYEHNTEAVKELVDMTYTRGNDDSTTLIQNEQMNQLSMFIDLANTLKTAFLIAGLVMAIFAFLLMFNFISASITAKKKEIGILRAIGARSRDVYKIFMSESLIMALICMVISIAGTFALCIILNKVLTEGTFIVVSVFSFGPISALCVLLVALVTAILSTVIPVALYSRKPPIESIRAL